MKSKSFWYKLLAHFTLLALLLTVVACQEEQAAAPNFPTTEFISTTDLFSVKVPIGWHTEEVVPGANIVMANTEAALERYDNDRAIESGDFVLNIGFLPMALFQEKELAHLNFQFEASPDVFLQSLLPMFRIGNESAVNFAEDVTQVSLNNGRDAGMLPLSEGNREGQILVFTVSDKVFGFVSASGFPGQMDDFEEIAYGIASNVTYSGDQEALYQALNGD